MKFNDIQEIVTDTILTKNRIVIKIDGPDAVIPNRGYAVPQKNTFLEFIFDEPIDVARIRNICFHLTEAFCIAHAFKLCSPGAHLNAVLENSYGSEFSSSRLYIQVVDVYPSYDEALKVAHARGKFFTPTIIN